MRFNRRTFLKGVGGAALLGGSAVGTTSAAAPSVVENAPVVAGADYPTLGTDSSNPTATVFGNFKCPYTREFVLGNLSRVVDEFVKTGRLNLQFRSVAYEPMPGDSSHGSSNWYISSSDPRIAETALAGWEADPNDYWTFLYEMFQNQVSGSVERSDVLARMNQAGMENLDAAEQLADDGKFDGAVRASAGAAREAGLQWTPWMEFQGESTSPHHAWSSVSAFLDARAPAAGSASSSGTASTSSTSDGGSDASSSGSADSSGSASTNSASDGGSSGGAQTSNGVPIVEDASYPTLGTDSSNPTATVFGNFKCPYTREFVLGNMDDLIDEFVTTGKLNLQFRSVAYEPMPGDSSHGSSNWYISSSDPRIAETALAGWEADLNDYWGFFRSMFQNQVSGSVERSDVLARMNQAGMENLDAAEQLADNEAIDNAVHASAGAAREAGLQWTPWMEFQGESTSPHHAWSSVSAFLQAQL